MRYFTKNYFQNIFYKSMNFQTYKIFQNVNGFYHYTISNIDDIELVRDIAENWGAIDPDNAINQYLTIVIGWDNIDCEKSTISPIDVINKNFSADNKNMVVSDEFKKFTEEEIQKLKNKKSRSKKVVEKKPESEAEKPVKKAPKPRGKKAVQSVVIETPKEPLNFNQ